MRRMSELVFAPEWLDLREPADCAARNPVLLEQALGTVRPGTVILDLGSGTGSTARAFGNYGSGFRWRFLDGDARLLRIASNRHPKAETVIASVEDPDSLPLDGVGLVTASALLDLMPGDWIGALAKRLSRAGIPFYAALTYNGEMSWSPGLPVDASITAAFNQHQLTDKGIGAAAGPEAVSTARAAFERYGYEVAVAESPWVLGPEDTALQSELLSGIAAAALEMGHDETHGWLAARSAALARTTARIGHADMMATPL